MVDVMGGSRTLPEVLETGIAWVRSIADRSPPSASGDPEA